jgi:hypothetical protein
MKNSTIIKDMQELSGMALILVAIIATLAFFAPKSEPRTNFEPQGMCGYANIKTRELNENCR